MTNSESAPHTTPPETTAPRRRWLPWILAFVGVLVVAAAVAIPVSVGTAQRAADEERAAAVEREAELTAAREKAAEAARLAVFRDRMRGCGVSTAAHPTVEILDGGEALQIERVTKYDGPSYAQMKCILNGLKAPSSVEAEISQTRALDGRQTDTWEGFSISWSYHPDDGASILIKHTKGGS